jgi:prepilin-type N-terminal cleavage/methylation domain-containing protein
MQGINGIRMQYQIRPAMRPRPVGFTLVELLIVITIIAVLVAMLIPSLQSARETAGRIKCGANLRQIAFSMMVYANDFNQWGPGPSACDDYYNSFIIYKNADVRPYFPDFKILVCPSQDPVWLQRATFKPGAIYNPASSQYLVFGYRIYFGWGLKTDAADARNINGWTVTGSPTPQYTQTHNYRVPAANMKFYGRLLTSANGSTCFCDEPMNQAMIYDCFNPDPTDNLNMPGFYVMPSHCYDMQYGLNVLYADGHNKWKRPDETIRRFQNFNFCYW